MVVRQIRYFRKMDLSDDVEIIFVDDGSEPPLNYENSGLRNFHIYYTHDKRPWTQGLARNFGVSNSTGEYIFITDIDHILTKEAIEAVCKFNGDLMVFPRYYGILGRNGELITDVKSMLALGARYRPRLSGGFHMNTFAMKRDIFNAIGGYDDRYCSTMFHVGVRFTSEEGALFSKYRRGGYQQAVGGPITYFVPTGRYRIDGSHNPFGLFHNLSLEQVPQPMME